MPDSITRLTLENGLTIQLKEIHTAPIISHWVWYRVGARDETPGLTGSSHWVEHMQFKGTKRFTSGILDKAISRDGGVWNAFTYLDWTTYYETMPSNKIDLSLELEADRMRNSVFDPEEVEAERTVIISELEGNENEPTYRLGEAVQTTMFDQHPYRNEVIGSLEDLNRMSRDDLYQHYQTYYQPNNALVAIAGDFDTQEMINQLTRLYQHVPAGRIPSKSIPVEPPLGSERRVEVKGPGSTAYMQIAYRAPAASEPDFFSFTILDSLLCGPTSLNMFGGGGISNKTSRLYRAVVDKELAVSLRGGLHATIDPFVYDIFVTLRPDHTAQEILDRIDQEISRLQNELVREDEIHRALKQARALFAYGSENITNQAFWLGFAEMFDTYEWFSKYVEKLETVTPQDILRVAQTYLVPSRRVIGQYIPTGSEDNDE